MPESQNMELSRTFEDLTLSRGDLYVELLSAIQKRLGHDEAVAVMKEAINSWGKTQGRSLLCHAPENFLGLLNDFGYAPDNGKTFGVHVEKCDDAGLDVQMTKCPLKDAWTAAGLADDQIALLCEIAAEADYGALEAAGFKVSIDTWQQGKSGCCVLHIRKKN